jgi:hypothetical protein
MQRVTRGIIWQARGRDGQPLATVIKGECLFSIKSVASFFKSCRFPLVPCPSQRSRAVTAEGGGGQAKRDFSLHFAPFRMTTGKGSLRLGWHNRSVGNCELRIVKEKTPSSSSNLRIHPLLPPSQFTIQNSPFRTAFPLPSMELGPATHRVSPGSCPRLRRDPCGLHLFRPPWQITT